METVPASPTSRRRAGTRPRSSGIACSPPVERLRDGNPSCHDLVGRRGVAGEEALGQAHASELERHRGHRRRPSERDLRRAAADVHHEGVALERAEVGTGAPVRQLALLGVRTGLRGRHRRPPWRPRRTSAPFSASLTADVATMRSRSTPKASMDRRNSRSTSTVRAMASGASCSARSTPWPNRVIRMSRISSPTVRVGHQEPGGVGATVDCRHGAVVIDATRSQRGELHLLGHPSTDGVVAAGQPPGHMGVQALHAVARAAHPSVWPRPGPIGRDQGVPFLGVAGVRLCKRLEIHGALRPAGRLPVTRGGPTSARISGSTNQ